jgi:hypothetical protein
MADHASTYTSDELDLIRKELAQKEQAEQSGTARSVDLPAIQKNGGTHPHNLASHPATRLPAKMEHRTSLKHLAQSSSGGSASQR